MFKKILAVSLSILMITAAAACGNKAATDNTTAEDPHAGHNHGTTAAPNSNVIADSLFTVELTLPAEYIGETTQEQLNATADEMGYKSITLNEDGSATYIMTELQHDLMLKDISNTLKDTVNGMVGSADYPSFASVTVNDDFTSFMVTTISTEYGDEEQLATMTLLMVSGIYHIFKGEEAENVHIDYVNYDNYETIYSYDSVVAAADQ